jgi:mono/diheme cytochrome c family protein
MTKNNLLQRTNVISTMLVIALGFGLCEATPSPALANDDGIQMSIVRGGRLYDNWYSEIQNAPPDLSHAAYPAKGEFAANPSANWRCTECHGWDYLGRDGAYSKGPHYTGIKGIQDMAGADPSRIVSVLKNETHGYAQLGLMEDSDFQDLANFISFGQVDSNNLIDSSTRTAKGDVNKAKDIFQVICANCHGLNGQKIGAMPPLGMVAMGNPWKALHSILNGHPNALMPALRALGVQTAVNILAYTQSLPRQPTIASIARGGRLYNNWHKEIGARPPIKSHPSYPPDKTYAKLPRANWRCKECHGWDYKGNDGAYSKSPHYTGINGIRNMEGIDPASIVAVLKDETHRFFGANKNRAQMKDRDFRDIANFVSYGQIDMDAFIDRDSKIAKGDKTKHEDLFQSICANCHGMDGQGIFSIPSLSATANNDPWRVLHNILNGHPGESMPALRVLGLQTGVDILAYIQALPSEWETIDENTTEQKQ